MSDKILIYDDHCPFCTWYAGLFVRSGLLPANGSKPYSTLDPALRSQVDPDRSRNEIPLIDTRSGKVFYGIDALLEVLGSCFPLVKKIGSCKPLYWLLKKSYRFVSYNRKVIVGTRCGKGLIDCSPDLNITYRVLFMLVALLFNTLMLFPLHTEIFLAVVTEPFSIAKVQAAHFGIVLSNCTLAITLGKPKAIEYLGQVSVLSLMTILLLLPILLINYRWPVPAWICTFYMLSVAVLVFKEYLRRMEFANVLPLHRWVAAINLAP